LLRSRAKAPGVKIARKESAAKKLSFFMCLPYIPY
jgi:hypothetical protein